jgi:hypothetical protein
MNWRRLALPIGVGVLAVGAFTGAAVAASKRKAPGSGKPATRPDGLSAVIDQLARKWAKARGLPAAWVLSTIMVESGGDPNRVVQNAKEASYGLMQINTNAHRARLDKYGVNTPQQLLDPDTNIKIGTEILREAWDNVAQALGGQTPPGPLDVLVRYSYVGPLATRTMLQQGKHPREALRSTGEPIFVADRLEGRWARALANTGTVV